jgi:hypothetical protein
LSAVAVGGVSQVIWAIILTKDNLWEFILDESYPDRPIEILRKAGIIAVARPVL